MQRKTLDQKIEDARRWYEKVLAEKGVRAAERYRVRLTTLTLKRAGY